MKYARITRAIIRPEIIIPVFFLSFIHMTAGQSLLPGARSLALGTISAVSDPSAQPPQNPALLGHTDSRSFSASHARPFVLKEFGVSSMEAVIPANTGAFQFRIKSYGLKGYRIFASELGFGMPLSEKIAAGILFNYRNTATPEHWNYLWTISPGAGIYFIISPRTSIALLLNSPVSQGNYPEYGPLLPSALSIGLSHEIYHYTTLLSEVTCLTPKTLRVKTGLEYRINQTIVLLAGYHSEPHAFSFGAALERGSLQIDIAYCWMSIPGIIPAVTLSYTPLQ